MKSDNLQSALRARINNQAIADKRRKRRDRIKQAKRNVIVSPAPKGKAKWKPKPSVFKVSPNSNTFLESYEWRKVRMQALKKYGATCQCCGASRKTGAVIHVDHIKPRKLFPHLALSLDNLQVLCHECNHGKGNWDMTDWR